MKNSTLWIIIGIVVVTGAVSAGALAYQKFKTGSDQVACTMEAMQCPDGSYVGRQGPKCEFAKCPSQNVPSPTPSQNNPSSVTSINNPIVIKGVTITPTEVVSDSRCPSDVQCIWAGNVGIRMKATYNGTTTSAVLSIGTSVKIGNRTVTLTAVSPSKISNQTIKPADYRFTFSVALPESV